jgi:nucleotide-binding universal stress UspA family protein
LNKEHRMSAPIIAAYNPYTEDRAPVELALAAAEQTGASVVAVSVYPWELSEGLLDPYADDGDTQTVIVSALQRLREDLGVETRVATGLSAPEALHEIAEAKGASLIVVGSTRRNVVGRVLSGSTAERLLQGAPCPILLAPKGYARTRLGAIAVGFADTPEASVALSTAHSLAARFGARLRVVAALHPSGGMDAAMARGMKPEKSAMLQGRHRTEMRAALDRAVEALPAGVDVEAELHVDDPADALLRISEHVDLLICGSRGYGPLRSVLLGGVSRRVVEGARCPVLVLPRSVDEPLDELLAASGATAVG